MEKQETKKDDVLIMLIGVQNLHRRKTVGSRLQWPGYDQNMSEERIVMRMRKSETGDRRRHGRQKMMRKRQNYP